MNGVGDIKKVETGDILVAHQTDPNILPAMKLAAAFVTDLGGITWILPSICNMDCEYKAENR